VSDCVLRLLIFGARRYRLRNPPRNVEPRPPLLSEVAANLGPAARFHRCCSHDPAADGFLADTHALRSLVAQAERANIHAMPSAFLRSTRTSTSFEGHRRFAQAPALLCRHRVFASLRLCGFTQHHNATVNCKYFELDRGDLEIAFCLWGFATGCDRAPRRLCGPIGLFRRSAPAIRITGFNRRREKPLAGSTRRLHFAGSGRRGRLP
jgi:hypothetical protein